MKYFKILVYIIILFNISKTFPLDCYDSICSWAVIGAGPAGIISVGLLLDNNVSGADIVWIDPEFNVGSLGKYYANVPSNTKTKIFRDFFKSSPSLTINNSQDFNLFNLDVEQTCLLKDVIDPLQALTERIIPRVNSIKSRVRKINKSEYGWFLELETQSFHVKNVILCIGSEQKKLNFQQPEEIPLHIALDPCKLQQFVNHNDRIAVFGVSHSGMLALKNLCELKKPVEKILSFANKPVRFALPIQDGHIHENTGLKGTVAEWARDCFQTNPPPHLIKLDFNEKIVDLELPSCTKVIYAIGFERRDVPGLSRSLLDKYDTKTGLIDLGLYGLGIAFPGDHIDFSGEIEKSIGIRKFLLRGLSLIPLWIHQA